VLNALLFSLIYFLIVFYILKVLTKVSFASVEDVDKAVAAAKVNK